MEVKEGKYLVFSLKEEYFGLPITKVKEIIGLMDITHVPKMPAYMKGVINLRGKIIPIMDLQVRFGMEGTQYSERTCIIVTEVQIQDIKRLMGIVVDVVVEVANIQSEDIEPPPQYEDKTDMSFLTGIAKGKDKVILLLEIECILNREELIQLKDLKVN
ncbi:MAG: chemotaxis protein CheW [Bacillota bacterium]